MSRAVPVEYGNPLYLLANLASAQTTSERPRNAQRRQGASPGGVVVSRVVEGKDAVQITVARTNDVTVFSTPGMAAISFHT